MSHCARLLTLVLLLVSQVCSAESAEPSGGVALRVDRPAAGQEILSPIGLVEVRGYVDDLSAPAVRNDVVIAIDRSQSSLLSTGIDLDRDGVVGALKRGTREDPGGYFRGWTTDFDDIVLFGERAAAQRLVDSLDPETARVAVMTFSGRARVRLPLGPVASARADLAKLSVHQVEESGSNFEEAIRRGLRLFEAAPPGEGAQRSLLLLTDGIPTAPRNESTALRRAVAAAEKARAAGVRVFTFEMINEGEYKKDVLDQIARAGGGERIWVGDPAELAFRIPGPPSSALAGVEIENLTNGARGEAVRVFPTGVFDAFLRLDEGANRIRVVSTLRDGRQLELIREVTHRQPERPRPSDTARLERTLEELRHRAVIVETMPQPERKREVEVEIED